MRINRESPLQHVTASPFSLLSKRELEYNFFHDRFNNLTKKLQVRVTLEATEDIIERQIDLFLLKEMKEWSPLMRIEYLLVILERKLGDSPEHDSVRKTIQKWQKIAFEKRIAVMVSLYQGAIEDLSESEQVVAR
jgi:hypothetical protein